MDPIVRQALENARASFTDLEWFTMLPDRKADLIHEEIRQLDLARHGQWPAAARIAAPSHVAVPAAVHG